MGIPGQMTAQGHERVAMFSAPGPAGGGMRKFPHWRE